MKASTLLIILIALFWFNCSSEKEEVVFQLPENASELLAGKDAKTWKLAKRTNGKTRVNMGECTMAYRQTFERNNKVADNNKTREDCGPSIEGTWQFSYDKKKRPYLAITSEMLPKLFKLKNGGKTKHFQIVTLTDSLFVYRFAHELFTNKTTIIEDVLIPENVIDNGRNFHW